MNATAQSFERTTPLMEDTLFMSPSELVASGRSDPSSSLGINVFPVATFGSLLHRQSVPQWVPRIIREPSDAIAIA